MANPKSYAWSQQLYAVVPAGEDAQVNTPGLENPDDYKTDEAEVVVNGNVLLPEQFTLTWEEDWSHAHVTNGTETDWQPGDTVYVTVAGIPFDPTNVEASFTALEAQVSDHETRITALETPVTRAGSAPAAKHEHDKNERAKDNHGKADHDKGHQGKNEHKPVTKAKVTVTASKTFTKKPAKPAKKPAKKPVKSRFKW